MNETAGPRSDAYLERWTNGTLAVVGLGYVGLPLAVEFGRIRETLGFDIDGARVAELRAGHDRTLECTDDELRQSLRLDFTTEADDLRRASVYIVTVPTPIDRAKRPDLGPLRAAALLVSSVLHEGDLVVFESTVYPGATEEVCVPILEEGSGLTLNERFFVGYSPERINPGDKVHRLPDIVKVTSGSSPSAARGVDAIYRQVVRAGTHPAPSIRVAEAAKVIENTQRDVNIALVNELAILFRRLGIDTLDVLAAAGTKWNFLPFRPGLVGGHCIGVDPYYLTHKSQEVGHHPDVILAGRRINDGVGEYVADQLVLLMAQKGRPIAGSHVMLLGLAFKENCPDVRNSRVFDIIARLREYSIHVDVVDPWVDPEAAENACGIALTDLDDLAGEYDAAVLAVAHRDFLELAETVRARVGSGVIFDVKGAWPRTLVDARL